MIKAVVLDVDGVFIDSIDIIVEAYLETARKLNFRVPSRQEIIDLMGRPLEEITRTLWPNSDIALYMKRFRRLFKNDDLVIPRIKGAQNAVQQIRDSGFKIGLVTGKIEYFAERHLKNAGFDLNMFGAIVSFETTKKHKPDPEPLHYALDKLDVRPEETVYVGDSISDFECAKNAGIRYVAVLTGSLERAEVEKLGVKNIVKSVTDLPDFLKEAL